MTVIRASFGTTSRMRNQSSLLPVLSVVRSISIFLRFLLRRVTSSKKSFAATIIFTVMIFGVRKNSRNTGAHPTQDHDAFLSTFRNEIIKRQELLKDANRSLRTLPSYCSSSSWPDPTYKEIIIKGERHSGTNWVRSILEKNVKRNIKVDQSSLDIGWKHGFLPPQGWGRPIEKDDLLIVVTRDVFTWLPKMYQETYDPEMRAKKKGKYFHEFIRLEYSARCQPMADKLKPNLSDYQMRFCKQLHDHGHDAKEKFDAGNVVAEVSANVIQIRTEKYKQWLSDNPGVEAYNGGKENYLKRRVHLRLEDLTNSTGGMDLKTRQEHFVADPLTERCVPVYEDFRETVERTKWKGYMEKQWKGKEFNADHERLIMLKRYTKEDLRFVLSQLDLEFEKKLGYNYDYVYDLLNSSKVREHPPSKRLRKPKNRLDYQDLRHDGKVFKKFDKMFKAKFLHLNRKL